MNDTIQGTYVVSTEQANRTLGRGGEDFSAVDASMITGESIPVEKRPGD